MIFVLAPPHAYDHPYHGPVVERVMPLATARALCGKRGALADACSWTEHGTCYVVLPRGGPVRGLASYRRHEGGPLQRLACQSPVLTIGVGRCFRCS
jgi:hypothetical protein